MKGPPGSFGARCQFQKPVHFNSVSSWIYFSRSLKIEWQIISQTYTKKTFGAPSPEQLDIRSAVPFVILICATKF